MSVVFDVNIRSYQLTISDITSQHCIGNFTLANRSGNRPAFFTASATCNYSCESYRSCTGKLCGRICVSYQRTVNLLVSERRRTKRISVIGMWQDVRSGHSVYEARVAADNKAARSQRVNSNAGIENGIGIMCYHTSKSYFIKESTLTTYF